MLRLKVLVSIVPLIATALFARGEFAAGARPCIAIGDGPVQLTSVPWQAQLHVSFTSDPAAATVRVQISDSADAADFAVVDDIDVAETGTCAAMGTTRYVAISENPAVSAPVIYLSPDGPADYRIFVRSKSFTARDAAALIVGASGEPGRVAAASL